MLDCSCVIASICGLQMYVINVKKTTVYTHVNGDRLSHIENSKNKKSYFTILLHIDV